MLCSAIPNYAISVRDSIPEMILREPSLSPRYGNGPQPAELMATAGACHRYPWGATASAMGGMATPKASSNLWLNIDGFQKQLATIQPKMTASFLILFLRQIHCREVEKGLHCLNGVEIQPAHDL